MRDIDATVRLGNGDGDNMNDMMKDSIKQIKVLALFPTFPASRSRLSRIHTQTYVFAIGTSVVLMDFRVYLTQ